MTHLRATACAVTALLGLTACAATPMGPSVSVMPGPNKPFDVFAQDQAMCKDYASQQVAGQAEAANNRAIGSAVIGTVLGAGLGAAVGGGRGAAIGAGAGAMVGTGYGASGSDYANLPIQRRYDISYSQCMYSRGNQVPGYYAQPAYAPGPPPGYAPPPPGYAPPPPPPPGYR
jgi:uncharacterized protein YcfJ